MQFDADGSPLSMQWILPEEESLESLAARLRPVELQSESTDFLKAITAAQFLDRNRPGNAMTVLAGLRRRYQDLLDPMKAAYQVQIGNKTGPLGHSLSTPELAHGWLYGDLVHADHDEHATSRAFDFNERFRAAWSFYANLALLAVTLVDVLTQLQRLGWPGLPESCFEEPVVVSDEAPDLDSFRVFVAETGAETPDFESDMAEAGSTWSEFHPARGGVDDGVSDEGPTP